MNEKTIKSCESDGVTYQVIRVFERMDYPSIYHESNRLGGKPVYYYEVREVSSFNGYEYSSTIFPYRKALEWFKDKSSEL